MYRISNFFVYVVIIIHQKKKHGKEEPSFVTNCRKRKDFKSPEGKIQSLIILLAVKHICDWWFSTIPVPSCSRWWQRWMSSCASWSDTPREGTNQGAKQESTRVQAASAMGDTNWSQGSWDPHSLSKLERKRRWSRFGGYFSVITHTAMMQHQGQISVQCLARTMMLGSVQGHWLADCRGQGSNHWPSGLWMTTQPIESQPKSQL